MDITMLVRKLFDLRLKEIAKYTTHAGEIQQEVLLHLVGKAQNTEWGIKYNYKSVRNYDDYKSRVPVQTYDDIKPYVDRLRAGENYILWSSKIRWFAKSSGTTNDKSKFLPISKEALRNIHYKGGVDAVALYLQMNPESKFFSGKSLVLGGSHRPDYNLHNSLVGDLSAILLQNAGCLVNYLRVPS
ncbi:hypothetical protein EZS27_026998, partial [termite gut metagenome]